MNIFQTSNLWQIMRSKEFQVIVPTKVLKENKEALLKVRAVFDHNSSDIIYLDSTQYKITTSDPKVAAVDGDVLKKSAKKERQRSQLKFWTP